MTAGDKGRQQARNGPQGQGHLLRMPSTCEEIDGISKRNASSTYRSPRPNHRTGVRGLAIYHKCTVRIHFHEE